MKGSTFPKITGRNYFIIPVHIIQMYIAPVYTNWVVINQKYYNNNKIICRY